jgi:hypothetical protein
MMSLGLTKPGLRSVDLSGKKHPITGHSIAPIGHLKDGTAVWPVMGGSEDEDDPEFTGEGGDDDEDEDESDEEPKGKKKAPVKKSKDDEDEDDEEEKLTRPERQAARYRTQLRAEQAKNAELAERLKALEDKDKPADELSKRELDEAREKASRLEKQTREMTLELAFFKSNTVDWVDPSDALRLVDLDEVDVDEDGTVDAKALRLALRDLAKRKPHLVKKAKTESDADEDEDQEDEEPRSRRSGSTMNSRRKGKGQVPSREQLAKKFPVLGRL